MISMYALFTDTCRQVMQKANREAMLTNSQYISCGHALVALTNSDSDPIAELLRDLGAQPEKTRAQVSRLLKTEKRDLPESPHLKKVVGYMLEIAKNLCHENIGTEHLLLGLLRDRDCIAVRALEAMGLDIDSLQAEVTRRLPAGSPEKAARKKAQEERFCNHPEVLDLKQRISQLQRSLEEAVVAQQFDKAAAFRDERRVIEEQLKQIYNRLDQGG
jgi:ATP-dependent Clp protease ATP-binding subunit ClpA